MSVASAAAGVLGLALTAVGVGLSPDRAALAYLFAWVVVVTVPLGALLFLLIGDAIGAGWTRPLRRLTAHVARGVTPAALLGAPLVLLAPRIWPWLHDNATLPPSRAAWLDGATFLARGVGYLAVWVATAELLGRRPQPVRRAASVLLPVIGVTATFAAFDWLMSLTPTWWSSAYGMVVTAGALAGGVAVLTVLAARVTATGALPTTGHHLHALGRVLLATILVWGYLAYFQAFLIDLANLPSEVPFLLARARGGWPVVTALLVATQLVVPAALLLPRAWKQRPTLIASIASVVLVGHVVDVWWLVLPSVGASPIPTWLDVSALVGIAGVTTTVVATRARRAPLLPSDDDEVAVGLAYRSRT